MTRTYVFNGDADGLCALQQLRLADGPAAAHGALVTGVKRDIDLLGRVAGGAGDDCTVLDVSLDVNRAGLNTLLAAGVRVRYFDHHFAGEIPAHPGLEAHIDPPPRSARACSSTDISLAASAVGRSRGRSATASPKRPARSRQSSGCRLATWLVSKSWGWR